MEAAGCRLNLLFLDACRTNELPSSTSKSLAKGLADMDAAAGMLISFASARNTEALDSGSGSVYTNALLAHIPRPVVKAMQAEADEWSQRIARERECSDGVLSLATVEAWEQFQKERFRRLEKVMDSGHGASVLRVPASRGIVERALHHFEGERCRMGAFAIMPNHVHAVCQPLSGFALEDLAGSWKKFTAQEINGRLGRRGRLWQYESFDRIVRDAEHYRRTVRCVLRNPEKAGLYEDEATVWVRTAT